MTPIASVIIPAHNEGPVIGRCLNALLADAAPGEFEVVVAANACTDRTVEIASDHVSVDVRIVETAVASKVVALNLAEQVARAYPRIYLDADIVLPTTAARALSAELSAPSATAASPRMRVDASRSSGPARAYLRIWQQLPVFRSSYVGSGCYALSAAGRARFGRFPEVTNDDQFVNDLYSDAEKVTLDDQHFIVTAPRNLRAIVRRSIRVRTGAAQLGPATASAVSTKQFLLERLRDPRDTAAATLFIATQVAVRLLSKYRELRGHDSWLRDETSRSPA